MSKFLTILPLDVDEMLSKLPGKHFLHGITYNPKTKSVEVHWEHDKLETGLSVPVPFPLELIGKRKLPEGVRKVGTDSPAVSTVQVKQSAPESKPEAIAEVIRTVPPNYFQDKETLEAAISNKERIEFQGLETVWKPFNPDSMKFEPGFFYRKIVDNTPKPT